MLTKNCFLLYFTCLTSVYRMLAQDPTSYVNPTVKVSVPPSPTSAALGKYGDISVNESSGIPSISIPLYSVNVNEYSLPISLSYHAGGIKVEEDASWVGLAWSLNAGGVITRSMHGFPDEIGYTNGDGALIPAGTINPNTQSGFNLLRNCTQFNTYDLQPDEYFFNFGKYTGKFVISPTGNILLIPFSNLKVVKTTVGGQLAFNITAEDGIMYQFAAVETSDPLQDQDGGRTIPIYISSWYLTSITFPTTASSITFNYSSYGLTRQRKCSYAEYWQVSTPAPNMEKASVSNNGSVINGLHLSSINYPEGRVDFVLNTSDRVDLPGDKSLDMVKVYNKTNQLIKSWKLHYSYYNNADQDATVKKLQLQKVQEIGNSGSQLEPYAFTYNAQSIPGVNSNSQDHWGYYNAQPNSKLIPAGSIGNKILSGADRSINSTAVKAGILEKITYPTGGTTAFEFESNTLRTNEPLLQTVSKNHECNAGPQWGTNTCYWESLPFVLNSITGKINANVTLVVTPGNYARVSLINTANNSEIVLPGGNTLVDVPLGTYKFVTQASHGEPVLGNDRAYGAISWQEPIGTIKEKTGPGLRIKTITTSDGIAGSQPIITKYEYKTFTDNTESSGFLSGYIPVYEYDYKSLNTLFTGSVVKYKVRTTNSQADLGSGGGVCYTNVKKILGNAGENGFINSYYTFFSSSGSGTYPFPPCINFDYKNGLLTQQSIFSSTGKLLKEIKNSYVYSTTDNYNTVTGLSIGYAVRNYDYYGGAQKDFDNNEFVQVKYSYTSQWFYLSSTTTTAYDQNGSNGSSVTTFYEYSNPVHMQATAIATILENAGTNTQRATYVRRYFLQDYTFPGTLTGTSAALKAMSDKHIWNTPIEQLNYSIIGSVYRFTGGELTTFKMNGTSVVKDKDYSVKCNGSTIYQDLISVTPASVNSSGQFIYDAHYEQLNSYNRYDANNNLVEVTDRKNTSSLIREPNTGEVWAKIDNGNYASVAYSSFEHTGPSAFTNWNYNVAGTTTVSSQNGLKAFNLTGNPVNTSQALIATQKYKVSFWRKLGSGSTLSFGGGSGAVITSRTGPARNGWQYFELMVNNATSFQISGNYIIDELRLYPQSARMISYVYKDGVGPISHCDENNQNTFWEYDEFNRLKLTKDQDGYILKKNDYQYQYIQN